MQNKKQKKKNFNIYKEMKTKIVSNGYLVYAENRIYVFATYEDYIEFVKDWAERHDGE